MTTREELVDGFRMVIREATRVTSGFAPDDWSLPVHGDEGWNRKQIYSHVAATAEIAPGFLNNLGQASEDDNPIANIDVNAFNAQLVAAKQALSPKDLMSNLTTSYEKLIEFTRNMTDEQLAAGRKFGRLEGRVSDVMDSVLVLHGLAHIYSAGGSAV